MCAGCACAEWYFVMLDSRKVLACERAASGLGAEENRITLPCPPLSTIPFHAHAPASPRVAQSPRHPSRCYPREPRRTHAPTAKLFVRGRADRAREPLPALAQA